MTLPVLSLLVSSRRYSERAKGLPLRILMSVVQRNRNLFWDPGRISASGSGFWAQASDCTYKTPSSSVSESVVGSGLQLSGHVPFLWRWPSIFKLLTLLTENLSTHLPNVIWHYVMAAQVAGICEMLVMTLPSTNYEIKALLSWRVKYIHTL
jgi:hypothetical protein